MKVLHRPSIHLWYTSLKYVIAAFFTDSKQILFIDQSYICHEAEQVNSSGNAYDLYSGGAQFESQLGQTEVFHGPPQYLQANVGISTSH
jgi:hypothetical protein